MKDVDWYRSVLDSMRDLVLVKGPNSALLWANKAFLDYYGMTNEELENIIDSPQSDPDDTLQYVKDDIQLFETGKDINIPSEPVTNSKGEVHYYHTVKSPIFDGGETVRSVGVSRPISDEEISQQKLSDLDVKVFTAPLRSIIDTLPIKAMLLDKNMRVVKCNEKWVQRFGPAPENTVEPFTRYLPDLSSLATDVEQAIVGNAEVESVIEVELAGEHHYFDFKTSPWRYPDDSVGGTLVVATDITAVKQQGSEVVQLAQRLNLALEASKVGVWELDITTKELIWDERMYKLYGIKETGATKAHEAFESSLHPDDRGRQFSEIARAVADEKQLDVEFSIIWPSGEIRSLRAIADTVRDESGNPVKMVGVSWDVTVEKNQQRSLKKLNTDLERANAELQQFSYRSSHDLKGPLTTIRSLTEFMLEDFAQGDFEEVKRNIEVIGQQAQSLEILVLDLLELARADLLVATGELIDFEAVCQEVKMLSAGLAEEKDVSVSSVVEVDGDWELPKARIFQIVNNLVSNGIKYANLDQENRYVRITVKDSQGELLIEVADNGIGIPCERKSDVFEMFKRFHSKEISGSGIGMYIVKKHVDTMQGDVDFDTSASGTCFRVKIKRNIE